MKQSGFSLTEVLIALGLMSLVALFAIPKIFYTNNNAQRDAIIRDSFASIGELYIQRLSDPDQPEADLSDGERLNFAQYLYTHLSFTEAIDPSTLGAQAGFGCLDGTATDTWANPPAYFTLPMGVTIRNICNLNMTAFVPGTQALMVRVRVPLNTGGFTEYRLITPSALGATPTSPEERYTTLHAFAPTMPVIGGCTPADAILQTDPAC